MKSPGEAAKELQRKWKSADQRELLLLREEAWPIRISIGTPSPSTFKNEPAALRAHLSAWRKVSVGQVHWESVRYQSGAEPLDIPVFWELSTLDELALAADHSATMASAQRMKRLLATVDVQFHRIIVRRLSLHEAQAEDDVVAMAWLATRLEPGCGMGRPLRAVGADHPGVDTKFLERNQPLLKAFLDARFEGQCSPQGLTHFLGCVEEGEHWLLVISLDDGLLPFARQRVRALDLAKTALPASHILVVENEQCAHQLPRLESTVAILGAGLNLEWLSGAAFDEKRIGYWGDLDSWGMTMLASARTWRPGLTALMMDEATFQSFKERAVVEPAIAGPDAPTNLSSQEESLYRLMVTAERGRLEQEYLTIDCVHRALREWRNSAP